MEDFFSSSRRLALALSTSIIDRNEGLTLSPSILSLIAHTGCIDVGADRVALRSSFRSRPSGRRQRFPLAQRPLCKQRGRVLFISLSAQEPG